MQSGMLGTWGAALSEASSRSTWTIRVDISIPNDGVGGVRPHARCTEIIRIWRRLRGSGVLRPARGSCLPHAPRNSILEVLPMDSCISVASTGGQAPYLSVARRSKLLLQRSLHRHRPARVIVPPWGRGAGGRHRGMRPSTPEEDLCTGGSCLLEEIPTWPGGAYICHESGKYLCRLPCEARARPT
jgi:hypothetical protein